MNFLSVDVGTSSCKGAIFSSRGVMLAVRSAVYSPRFSDAGFAELEAETFLEIVTGLVHELASIPEIEQIQAICFSSHGETIIPVSADGQALGPAILNIDGRAVDEAEWLERSSDAENSLSSPDTPRMPCIRCPRLCGSAKTPRSFTILPVDFLA